MEIWPSAYKHGISEDEMRHAIRNPFRVIPVGEIDMYIGAAGPHGAVIEVGVLTIDDDRLAVIHAMEARAKFLR